MGGPTNREALQIRKVREEGAPSALVLTRCSVAVVNVELRSRDALEDAPELVQVRISPTRSGLLPGRAQVVLQLRADRAPHDGETGLVKGVVEADVDNNLR